jgi:hypothetical protein
MSCSLTLNRAFLVLFDKYNLGDQFLEKASPSHTINFSETRNKALFLSAPMNEMKFKDHGIAKGGCKKKI